MPRTPPIRAELRSTDVSLCARGADGVGSGTCGVTRERRDAVGGVPRALDARRCATGEPDPTGDSLVRQLPDLAPPPSYAPAVCWWRGTGCPGRRPGPCAGERGDAPIAVEYPDVSFGSSA